MKLLPWLALPVIALSLVYPAVAQESSEPAATDELETVDDQRQAAPSTEASALLIPPRWTVDYNSSGGGYDGFGGLGFMLPVQQQPGQQLDYLQGRLTLTNGADLGGSLLFGHRQRGKCLFGNSDCFIGGYVGVDLTNTGEAAFPQVGLGLEMLGDLEMRLNGYLAVGNTQRRVEEARFNAPTDLQFQGSNLLFIDQNSRDRFQNALSGFDFELGGKLVRFGNGGDLRGYGAVYSYGGPQVDRYVGGRFRLEVRPNDVLRIGGGVQFDPEFGTNLLFQIAANFPSIGQRQPQAPGPTIDQLADPPLRQSAVVVADRTFSVPTTVAATAPGTGKPYEFIHVAPGRGNSSGTFEDPMNTIAAATTVTTPSTDIIYVQAGNAGGGFKLPDGVALLSVAPVQVIPTQFGQTALPGSGQGSSARPVISGSVTMGNNTLLSGFVIRTTGDNTIGINAQAGQRSDVMIVGNQVTTSGKGAIGILGKSYGAFGTGSERGGRLMISDNTVNTSGDNAIGIKGIATGLDDPRGGPGAVTISGNTVSTSGDGADGIVGEQELAGIVTVANNRVTTSGFSSAGITNDGITSGNTVTTTGQFATGINGTGPIINNVVTTTGTEAAGIRGDDESLRITGNRVITNGDYSTGISGSGSTITIADNLVTTSGDLADGISSNGDFVRILGNVVTTSGSGKQWLYRLHGPLFTTKTYGINSRGNSVTKIVGNTVTTSGDLTDSIVGRGNVLTITDNTVNSSGNGARFTHPAWPLVSVTKTYGISGSAETYGVSDFGTDTIIGDVTISNNIVTTLGSDTDGIDGRVSISGNKITTSDSNADGIIGNITITDNAVTTRDSSANSIVGYIAINGNTVETSGADGAGISSNMTISGNQVITASSSLEETNSGKTLGNAAIVSNKVTTRGDRAAGIITQFNGFEHLDTARAVVIGNTIETSGNQSPGVQVSSPGTETTILGDFMITDNTVSTIGDRSDGINAKSVGSLMIADNTVITSGIDTTGISSDGKIISNTVEISGDASIGIEGDGRISQNTVINTGSQRILQCYSLGFTSICPVSWAVGIRGLGEVNNNMVTTSNIGAIGIHGKTIMGNIVTTSGDRSIGIDGSNVDLDGASAIVTNNIVTTIGDNSMGIRGDSGFGTSAIISNNVVTASGNNSFGIGSDSGSFGFSTSITITDNIVTTSGNDSTGIKGTTSGDASMMIRSNTVTASGNDSTGIRGLGFGSITDNKVIASENSAHGVSFEGLGSIKIVNNIVEQAGRDSVRVELRSFPSSCLALSDNISQNPGSGIGYHLINSVDAGDFQIADSSPTFADTQANNVGTFIFEPDITSFTNVPDCP